MKNVLRSCEPVLSPLGLTEIKDFFIGANDPAKGQNTETER